MYVLARIKKANLPLLSPLRKKNFTGAGSCVYNFKSISFFFFYGSVYIRVYTYTYNMSYICIYTYTRRSNRWREKEKQKKEKKKQKERERLLRRMRGTLVSSRLAKNRVNSRTNLKRQTPDGDTCVRIYIYIWLDVHTQGGSVRGGGTGSIGNTIEGVSSRFMVHKNRLY